MNGVNRVGHETHHAVEINTAEEEYRPAHSGAVSYAEERAEDADGGEFDEFQEHDEMGSGPQPKQGCALVEVRSVVPGESVERDLRWSSGSRRVYIRHGRSFPVCLLLVIDVCK